MSLNHHLPGVLPLSTSTSLLPLDCFLLIKAIPSRENGEDSLNGQGCSTAPKTNSYGFFVCLFVLRFTASDASQERASLFSSVHVTARPTSGATDIDTSVKRDEFWISIPCCRGEMKGGKEELRVELENQSKLMGCGALTSQSISPQG